MDSKWCPKCQKTKSADEFHKEARRKSGLSSRCKACNAKKFAAYSARLAARPADPPSEKTCSGCQRTLGPDAFGIDRQRPDGLQSQCKVCRKASARLRMYGITREKTIEMLESQGGLCAVCRGPFGEKGFHVDHCHETRRVRGLLCYSCNGGLGFFQDDPVRLASAIAYLQK